MTQKTVKLVVSHYFVNLCQNWVYPYRSNNHNFRWINAMCSKKCTNDGNSPCQHQWWWCGS